MYAAAFGHITVGTTLYCGDSWGSESTWHDSKAHQMYTSKSPHEVSFCFWTNLKLIMVHVLFWEHPLIWIPL